MGKVKCPSCKSSQVLYRVRKNEHYCRICGHAWEHKTEKKEV